MKTRIKSNYFSLVFIIIMAALNFIFYKHMINAPIDKSITYVCFYIAPVLIMYLLKRYLSIEAYKIPSNFKFIFAFAFVFIFLYLIKLFTDHYKIQLNTERTLVVQLILIISILLTYFYLRFKFKVEKINFKFNLKILAISFLIGLIYLSNTILRIKIVGEINILRMIINFVHLMIYPSLYEELLFRGFLISGLKKLKLNYNLINIIQAFIFGIIHYHHFSMYGDFGFIGTSNQILIGYLLGQVYFYTGSLLPCIIIHTFCNLMF